MNIFIPSAYNLDVFYPTCGFLAGKQGGYLRPNTSTSKPKYSSCRECKRYSKCQKQYAEFHKPVTVSKETALDT